MESLHIEFQPKVKRKTSWIFNSFSKNDLKIVEDETSFEATKTILHQRLSDLRSGKVDLIAIEDYEKIVDEE